FAPRLFKYYTEHMELLRAHPDYRHLPRGNPYEERVEQGPEVFACHSENHPPSTFTIPHRDVMNLAFGWCAIFALGRFDPQFGGHLVLHDLKLIIPFPHVSCVMIPSAFLWHSNVPIREEEGRASLTFYTAGCLFRFIDNDFQTEARYVSSFQDEYHLKLHRRAKRIRIKAGANLYSRVSEIRRPGQAVLDPVYV
ncbi:hypothetical protein AGABI2DRAFT_70580, partial [Agaricus bisporus var. bisporus H97]|uniref:hypothetical protein n=1 Tax=Agaricus bisporus var. bisporus (strain H97 / ATCC MYA-4626 / FGSC 10389) TaxID=936046 RepID=UPI00029F6E8E